MIKSDKVRHLEIPTTKRQRNYLKRMNLQEAQVWFRCRCKITAHMKDNKCRYCESGENETQEQFPSCDFTKEIRKTLELTKETDKLVLWRKFT